MSIQEISSNFKRFLREGDTLLALLIISVGICSFLLGRASVSPEIGLEGAYQAESQPKTFIEASELTPSVKAASEAQNEAASAVLGDNEGGYVASKNGTKYHLPWCGSAKQIKEENKIWFKTKAEAEAAGYTPASNCKGI